MFGRATYLVLLFAWMIPVLAIQWHAGRRVLRRRWRAILAATLLPTIYLAGVDRYALGNGIWKISLDLSTGISLAGLPLEESLFFLVTNLVVVQSVMLFTAPEFTPAFARALVPRHVRAFRRALRRLTQVGR